MGRMRLSAFSWSRVLEPEFEREDRALRNEETRSIMKPVESKPCSEASALIGVETKIESTQYTDPDEGGLRCLDVSVLPTDRGLEARDERSGEDGSRREEAKRSSRR